MEFSGRREILKPFGSEKVQEYNEEFGQEISVDYSGDAAAQAPARIDIESILRTIFLSGSGTLS